MPHLLAAKAGGQEELVAATLLIPADSSRVGGLMARLETVTRPPAVLAVAMGLPVGPAATMGHPTAQLVGEQAKERQPKKATLVQSMMSMPGTAVPSYPSIRLTTGR